MVAYNFITEKEYMEASRRLAVIFDASPGTKEYRELKDLYRLIETYEKSSSAISYCGKVVAEKN